MLQTVSLEGKTLAVSAAGVDLDMSTSNSIILPADFERLARLSVRQFRRHSAVALRLAMAASATCGNAWFSVGEVTSQLGSGMNESAGLLASRLEQLGIVETRLTPHKGHQRVDARLTLSLVNKNHFYGRQSQRLMMDLEIYCRLHPRATPLFALLLVGVRMNGILSSDALAEFLEPEFDRKRSQSLATRPLRALAQAGVLTIIPNDSCPTQPFMVTPVEGFV
ncbi:hypothetical protein ACIGHN_12760 [Acidovorax sp. NPDC077693]|uniref:hypothetical protein n=1 Tax=unclassified Acidovorax TaxID=2684926 RepID=UPI0037CBFFE3